MPVSPDLGSILGALYLGGVGSAMLFGITNLQIYFYLKNYKEDSLFLKSVVVVLWFLDTLHMVFAIVDVWQSLVDSFGNYAALNLVPWSYRVQITITVIIVLAVQTLYTRRVWNLSQGQNRLWLWILIIVLAAGYASGIILIVKAFSFMLFSQLHDDRWSINFCFVMAMANDLMLAVAICHSIYPGTFMFSETKSMVWTIIRYVTISGALTSMCSIVGVITLFAVPNAFIFAGLTFILTKLYINSYLAMLNARKSIRNTAAHATQTDDLEARMEARIPDFARSWSSEETGPRAMGVKEKGVKVNIDIVRQCDERDVPNAVSSCP